MGISSSAISPLLFPAPNPPRYRPDSFPTEMLWLPRTTGTRLPCFFAQVPQARGVMIYFHGNGCDLGEMALDLREYAAEFQMNVLGVEWTGYGYNLGNSSEGALNQDALDAWTFVVNELKVPPHKIVIFGRSIGTGPAVWLSHRLTIEKVNRFSQYRMERRFSDPARQVDFAKSLHEHSRCGGACSWESGWRSDLQHLVLCGKDP